MSKMIVGTFDTLTQAEKTVRALIESGVKSEHVSVVASNFSAENRVHGFVTRGDVARSTSAGAAWVGGIFGLLVGAAFVWVPGVGPIIVAGSLAAALLGGVEGALTGAAGGGVIGALFGGTIEKEHLVKYEASLRAGQFLVAVSGNAAELDRARSVVAGQTANVDFVASVVTT